jgi:hypothetical protein
VHWLNELKPEKKIWAEVKAWRAFTRALRSTEDYKELMMMMMIIIIIIIIIMRLLCSKIDDYIVDTDSSYCSPQAWKLRT